VEATKCDTQLVNLPVVFSRTMCVALSLLDLVHLTLLQRSFASAPVPICVVVPFLHVVRAISALFGTTDTEKPVGGNVDKKVQVIRLGNNHQGFMQTIPSSHTCLIFNTAMSTDCATQRPFLSPFVTFFRKRPPFLSTSA
jgi:hypothetical protein